MKFGIGITTRNRPHVLEAALNHFQHYSADDCRVVIVDDNSDENLRPATIVNTYAEAVDHEVILRQSETRLGISKAKNACITQLVDCDHIFLFDDDAWPISHDWAERWASINTANNVGHSMFNVTDPSLLKVNPAYAAAVGTTGFVNRHANRMTVTSNCYGVVLYFSNKCLQKIGGYDINAPYFYGYEHAQMSIRAQHAGFTAGHRYLIPAAAHEMIYSVDISYRMLHLLPPLPVPWLSDFQSSVPWEDQKQAHLNSTLIESPPTYIPLVDPFPVS